jgi:hypothetical protein
MVDGFMAEKYKRRKSHGETGIQRSGRGQSCSFIISHSYGN